ncbi:MAG: thioredoxin family protein [Kiritimatiellae bacterium]|nr:thioredoxin family protein [Kiritimatiellia bacterium]
MPLLIVVLFLVGAHWAWKRSKQKELFVKNIKNIAIVVALIVVVAVVVIAKKNKQTSAAVQDKTPVAARVVPALEAGAAAPNPATAAEKLPRLVDLGATRCIPCKMMAPILEDLKKTSIGRLDVQFIDVWENPDAGKQYGINVIPTQIFFDAAGKELFRHEGFFGKDDILAKWKELGVDLK